MKIALEEYGHLVLLRLIDVTDDTVLVRKALYGVRTSSILLKHMNLSLIFSLFVAMVAEWQELMRNKEELLEVLSSRTGRLVLLQLFTPCSPRYFSQDTIKHLQPASFPTSDPSAQPVPVRYLIIIIIFI